MMLEVVNDSNFEEYLASPVAFLLIGKEGCGPCMEWKASLSSVLIEGSKLPSGIRFGRVMIGEDGLTNFMRTYGDWLTSMESMPYNSVWVNGVLVKEWSGGGDLDRLIHRLSGLGFDVV